MVRLGRALAVVHARPVLEGEPCLAGCTIRGDSYEAVFSHGDFCVANILVPRSDRPPVILDWLSAPWLGSPFVHASPLVDLVNFGLSLFVRRPFESLPVTEPAGLWLSFREAYAVASRRRPDARILRRGLLKLWSRQWRAGRTPRQAVRTTACVPSVVRAYWATT